ncbi:MAG: hypothetical protein ABIF09_10920 [Gemmatimonadota bacterium]
MIDRDPRSKASSEAIRALLFTILCLLLLTACEGQESSAAPFRVADSAGVAIVESTRPLWEKGEGWALSPEPEVAIGLVEGDERYLLNQVAEARRLSDGRIAVLDAGSYLLRLYDGTGRHLMDLGGEGDGPSEFRYPQFLGVVSDTLFVYEYAAGDLTWFSPDGEFLRTSNVFRQSDRETLTVVMVGYLEDRFGIGIRDVGIRERTLVEGLNRPPMRIWRFDLFNSGADSLFSVPGDEVMISFPGPGVTRHQNNVFGKTTYLAASKDRIYVAPTDAFSIQVFDREGILRRIIRRDETPHRVTRSDFDRWVEQMIEILDLPPDERAEMRRSAGELSAAETMPAFRWIAVDSEDNLWVEEWQGVGLGQGRFSVFRANGAWLGYVEIPEGLHDLRREFFQPWLEIGSDYLLGIWSDDLGVEQVRLYRIEKG